MGPSALSSSGRGTRREKIEERVKRVLLYESPRGNQVDGLPCDVIVNFRLRGDLVLDLLQ